MNTLELPFDNSYVRDLADFGVRWKPAVAPQPVLLFANRPLAAELGLPPAVFDADTAAAWWSGSVVLPGAEPFAQAYAGHQFGGFSPQLGDGRALLLGELVDTRGQRRDLAFKGSGRTPFSRGGDGKAAVGPMLREVLIGEAMHALGIPTTRALAVTATGEPVLRETMLPGAVLTRVAASHLRVGTFQYMAARGEDARVRQLVDYAIARHDPDLAGTPGAVLAWLHRVAARQARLVAQWMGVGFIHGVMNTDNMTISGETIDYGPCAFLEAFDPRAVFSSIDHGGRYAYANQPGIARWNLARLAETVLPLLDDDADRAVEQATAVVDGFVPVFQAEWRGVFRAKLGVASADGAADDTGDTALVEGLLGLMQAQTVDFTRGWRRLADVAEGREARWLELFEDPGPARAWLQSWHRRVSPGAPAPTSLGEDIATAERGPVAGSAWPDGLAARLRAANPAVIPRNHRVEEVLDAASDAQDLGPLQTLLDLLRRPFDATADDDPLAAPAPREVAARHRTFCGT
jgi:uncharacterized protein YdiU (UPF0061 family)